MKYCITILISFIISTTTFAQDNSPYLLPDHTKTRWASFENPGAEKGEGGKVAKGSKGYPYHVLRPGESIDILNLSGSGVVNRIWMTVDDLFNIPEEHRSIRIEMFWDHSDQPAVSAPLEDFFNQVFGIMNIFENELFASPEGRSFISYLKMPFRTSARIVLTNESSARSHRVFYDVNVSFVKEHPGNMLYLHAYWRRDKSTEPGIDFQIVPRLESRGRFLGCNIGITNFHKYVGWWGEGEVKIYLDGDKELPTLVGTGTEDYVGTGWGQGVFHSRFAGSNLVDDEKGLYAFYRFHIPDPIYFYEDIRVTIQQMGGNLKGEVQKMMDEGKPVIPVCFIDGTKKQYNFLDGDASYSDENFGERTWTNYYRQDDVCATSYLYLDTPHGVLDRVSSFELRK